MNLNLLTGNMSSRDSMLSIEENKVLKETNQRNVIRAKIKALNFRLLTCLDDERDEIESEIARLQFKLDSL